MNALLDLLRSLSGYDAAIAAIEAMLEAADSDRPAVSVDEPAEVQDALLALARDLDGDDAPDLPDDVTLAQVLPAIADVVTNLAAEQVARDEQAAAEAEALAEARAALSAVASADDPTDADDGEDGDGDGDDEDGEDADDKDDGDDEGDEDGEPASDARTTQPAAERTLRRPPIRQVQRRHTDTPPTAAAPAAERWIGPGGRVLETAREQAEALHQAWQDLSPSPGGSVKQRVMRQDIAALTPRDRLLIGAPDPDAMIAAAQAAARSQARWDAATSDDTLLASFCAPAQPFYGQPVVGSATRPIRDSFATMTADRGSVSNAPGPLLDEIVVDDTDGAVTSLTSAQIEAGVQKTIQCLIDCPELVTTTLDASAVRLCFSNFGSETWRERQDAFVTLARVAAARARELQLLAAIDASATMTATTWDDNFGSLRSLLALLDEAVTRIRVRNRDDDMMFNLIAPTSLVARLRIDALRSMNAEMAMWSITEAEIRRWARERGVNLVLSPDVELFGDITGTLGEFSNQVTLRLVPVGKFMHLSGPEWSIGVTRDGDDLANNRFQVFDEITETMMQTAGWQGLIIDAVLCENGASAGTIDVTCDY